MKEATVRVAILMLCVALMGSVCRGAVRPSKIA
jgi:hypothetical protein